MASVGTQRDAMFVTQRLCQQEPGYRTSESLAGGLTGYIHLLVCPSISLTAKEFAFRLPGVVSKIHSYLLKEF